MAYDSARRAIVLFGGYTIDDWRNRETWELKWIIPCDDIRKLKARCHDHRLKVKVLLKDERHDSRTVTIDVNGELFDITIKGDRAKKRLRDRTGPQSIILMDPLGCGFSKEVDCG